MTWTFMAFMVLACICVDSRAQPEGRVLIVKPEARADVTAGILLAPPIR